MHKSIVNLVTGIVFPAQILEDGSCIVLADITDSFPTIKEKYCGYSVHKKKAIEWGEVFNQLQGTAAQPLRSYAVDKIMTNQR